MWHPVGDLPARVYWRRRIVVLIVLLALLGGLVWLGVSLLSDRGGTGAGASDRTEPVPEPALARVVPSLSAVATPDPPPPVEVQAEPAATIADPLAGGPCTDDMITLEVRTPGEVAVGSKPTFEVAVANVSAVPCVRSLDKGLQEIVMLDAAGNRVWGSNDCFPEVSSDPRTLAPGEVVGLPLVWGGLTSEPTCTVPRVNPPPGTYALRARLDTKVSPDAPLVLS